jgi:hypothetical protein
MNDDKGWADLWWKALVEEPNDVMLYQLLSRPESHPCINYPIGDYTLFERVISHYKVHYNRIAAVLKAKVFIWNLHDVLIQALRAHHFEVIQILHHYGARFRRKDDIVACFNYFYMLSCKSVLKEENFMQEASYYAHLRDQLFSKFDLELTFDGWAYNLFYQAEKRKQKAKQATLAILAVGKARNAYINKDVARLIAQHMREPQYVFHPKWKASWIEVRWNLIVGFFLLVAMILWLFKVYLK